jgi:hypothetical protein
VKTSVACKVCCDDDDACGISISGGSRSESSEHPSSDAAPSKLSRAGNGGSSSHPVSNWGRFDGSGLSAIYGKKNQFLLSDYKTGFFDI